MALTAEDLAQLGSFIDSKLADHKAEVTDQVAKATTPQPQTNDEPQNQPENQPEYYVHLADGTVQVSRDSGSTHMVNDAGESVAVIGRYPRSA